MKSSNSAAQQTAILAGGSVVAQVITLLLTPVVTRLYAPDQFGLFATILALTIPLVAVSSLRYFDAIMLPESDVEANKLLQLSVFLNTLVSAMIFLAVLVFTGEMAAFFGVQDNVYVLYIVPLLVLLIGLRRIADAYLQRQRSYKMLASTAIVASIVDRTLTIVAGVLGYVTFWGLILGRVSSVLSALMLMVSTRSVRTAITIGADNSHTMLSAAKKYSSFAKYSWSAWIMQLTNELPVIVVGAYFNPVITGLYVLSRRVLLEPAIIIGEAISKIFYVKATAMHNKDQDISGVCEKLVITLFKLSVPPACVFVVAASDLFYVIFGANWADAGTYAVYLTPMYLMAFYIQPLARLFNVLDKQREMASFSIQRFFGMSLALMIGVISDNPGILFISMSVAAVFLGLSRLTGIFRMIHVNIRPLILALLVNTVVGICMAVSVLIIGYSVSAGQITMTLLAAGVCGIYYLAIYLLHTRTTNKLF